MAVTDNMSLTKNDAGAVDWHTDNEANLVLIDAHDHTTGKGVQLQAGGIAEGAIDTARLANLGVTNTKIALGAISYDRIADDAVRIAAIGTMVPGFLGRQGGSATNWSTPGTTDYESGINVRMQVGVGVTGEYGYVTITFPVAFAYPPLVRAVASNVGLVQKPRIVTIAEVSATTATLWAHSIAGSASPSVTLIWEAIGPEA